MSAYVFGLDFGAHQDTTALVAIDGNTNTVELIWRFKPPENGREALDLFMYHCKKYNPRIIWADIHGLGSANVEYLQSWGLPVRPFHTTAKSKEFIVQSVKEAIEVGELAFEHKGRIPHDLYLALGLAWYGNKYGDILLKFE